ncbi:hypothetical protein ACFS7Z_01245 [Pontibacter toksunensis]|uniref:Lipoprotein n=1 Tax=Pontibacter toksunensis TaxID=1332631 RepID=A0ABW6BMM1_9BACT
MDKLYSKSDFRKGSAAIWRRVISLATVLFLILLLNSCAGLEESPKYQFSEGYYKVKLKEKGAARRMYVEPHEEDSVVLYPLIISAQGTSLDTLNKIVLNTSSERDEPLAEHYTFAEPSFDLDLLTIPLKYRPDTEGFPRQLNTSFQAAVYAGLRTDYYRMGYTTTPLGNHKRHFNHFGFSMGIFSGLGSAFINEGFTNGTIAYEYDAFVLIGGVAGIVGVNNFTLGLCIGIDHLMDQNRQEWIYQHKPWVGLAFGLNLN